MAEGDGLITVIVKPDVSQRYCRVLPYCFLRTVEPILRKQRVIVDVLADGRHGDHEPGYVATWLTPSVADIQRDTIERSGQRLRAVGCGA
jgi:hypothetical protein